MVLGGIGGGGDKSLNPVIISIDETGSVGIEKCNKDTDEIKNPMGEVLDSGYTICGKIGWTTKCKVFKKTKPFETKNRANYALVKLNESTLWMTGGFYSKTEFITVDGAKVGIELPFDISFHCMVLYSTNLVLLIGGTFNDENNTYHSRTRRSWIIDTENDFNITDGPLLNEGRKSHNWGKMRDQFGNVLIVVSGDNRPVEILHTTVMDKWEIGKRTMKYSCLIAIQGVSLKKLILQMAVALSQSISDPKL